MGLLLSYIPTSLWIVATVQFETRRLMEWSSNWQVHLSDFVIWAVPVWFNYESVPSLWSQSVWPPNPQTAKIIYHMQGSHLKLQIRHSQASKLKYDLCVQKLGSWKTLVSSAPLVEKVGVERVSYYYLKAKFDTRNDPSWCVTLNPFSDAGKVEYIGFFTGLITSDIIDDLWTYSVCLQSQNRLSRQIKCLIEILFFNDLHAGICSESSNQCKGGRGQHWTITRESDRVFTLFAFFSFLSVFATYSMIVLINPP